MGEHKPSGIYNLLFGIYRRLHKKIIPKSGAWILLIAFGWSPYHFAMDTKPFILRNEHKATCLYKMFSLLLPYCSLPDIPADGIGGHFEIISMIFFKKKFIYIYTIIYMISISDL